MGSFGEKFYVRVINSLHSKRGLMLAVSAMIVLHLVTDLGTFLVPYTTGIKNPLYFENLGPNHDPVFSFNDILRWDEEEQSLYKLDYNESEDRVDKFNVTYIYIMNLIALIFLLFTPAYLWYLIFMEKKRKITKAHILFFVTSVFIYINVPVFIMSRIPKENKTLVGVDILTQGIPAIQFEYLMVVIASILLGIIFFALSFNERIKKYITIGCILVSMLFFLNYIYLFSTAISGYYVEIIKFLFMNSRYFRAGYFLIFFTMTIIFYVFGTLFFFWELIMDQKD